MGVLLRLLPERPGAWHVCLLGHCAGVALRDIHAARRQALHEARASLPQGRDHRGPDDDGPVVPFHIRGAAHRLRIRHREQAHRGLLLRRRGRRVAELLRVPIHLYSARRVRDLLDAPHPPHEQDSLQVHPRAAPQVQQAHDADSLGLDRLPPPGRRVAGLSLRSLPLPGARTLLHPRFPAVLQRRMGHQHPRQHVDGQRAYHGFQVPHGASHSLSLQLRAVFYILGLVSLFHTFLPSTRAVLTLTYTPITYYLCPSLSL